MLKIICVCVCVCVALSNVKANAGFLLFFLVSDDTNTITILHDKHSINLKLLVLV